MPSKAEIKKGVKAKERGKGRPEEGRRTFINSLHGGEGTKIRV